MASYPTATVDVQEARATHRRVVAAIPVNVKFQGGFRGAVVAHATLYFDSKRQQWKQREHGCQLPRGCAKAASF